ncbi:MAG: class II SORL domain-containing protein [Candidatus Omnitrophota bacterium]
MSEVNYTCNDDILCGVNVPKDKNNLVDLEKKHLPVISAPEKVKKDEPFEIAINIGGIDGVNHPNEAAHSIEWIEVYCGETFLGRASFSGGTSYGVAKFKVKLTHAHGPIKVLAKCNLHGIWENKKEITVE